MKNREEPVSKKKQTLQYKELTSQELNSKDENLTDYFRLYAIIF